MVRTTEEQLFETIDMYRVIVDAAEEGIWIADKDDRVTYVNKKLVDILGRTRGEIVGKKIFDFTDEKNRALMKESIEGSRKGRRDTYKFSVRSKDGQFVPMLVSTTPMQDKQGRYIGTVQLCSDMSVQVKIEEDLREAKAKADMYLDLLSHDIRNIDQLAMGYLEMALNKLDSGEALTQKDREMLEKPLNSLRSSADLIDNVKNLQKVKSARLPMHGMDLCETLTSVVDVFLGVAGRSVKIHYRPLPGCQVEANSLLKEIFINLIGNSIKHSTGPLDVYVHVDKTFGGGRDYFTVTVEDNGPGIPDQAKARLFDEQLCQGQMVRAKGLGMCIVKSLVDSFQGKIEVEDRVPEDYSKGVRFRVLLPVAGKA